MTTGTRNMETYRRKVTLRDGDSITIRALTTQDEDALYDFFLHIPEDDRHFLRDDVTSPDVVREWTKNTDPLSAVDSDSDGLPDDWELFWFENLTSQNASGDPDGDQLSNAQEWQAGSNPLIAGDDDGDGLLDSWEQQYFGNTSQGANGDPDGDGVTNALEYALGTNPNASADANEDGIADDWVVWQLSLSGGVETNSLPANGDPDQDGLTNLIEYQRGTNPRRFDSDGDGQSDWQELAQQTNPNSAGSFNTVAVEASVHQGTTNLVVAQNLLNPASTATYTVALNGVAPAADAYEMKSSNQSGGPAYEWIDISTTGEHLTAFNSTANAIVTRSLPFAFPFYGTNYNNLYISGHG